MNPEARKKLDEILQKDQAILTKDEIGFIRARRSYLKRAELVEYQDILEDKKEVRAEEPVIGYSELLEQAKGLGYKGPRISRKELDKFIKEKQ